MVLARTASAAPALAGQIVYSTEPADGDSQIRVMDDDGRDLLIAIRSLTEENQPADEVVLEVVDMTSLARQLREEVASRELLEVIADLSERIRGFDQDIEAWAKRFAVTERLRQIKGVGALTALTFVLTLVVTLFISALINREKLVAEVYQGTTDPLYSLIPAGITGHTTSFFDANPKPDPQRTKTKEIKDLDATIAFFTDPWGTYIELNERPNPL